MRKILSVILLFLSFNVYAKDFAETVKQIQTAGDALIKSYQPETSFDTMDGFSNLYFDYYEGSGMEVAVAALSPQSNLKTESFFTKIIGSANQSQPKSELKKHWKELKSELETDLTLLKNASEKNFTETILQSFTILLREGFEALLIVTALLTYLRRAGHEDKSRVIHGGVIVAFIASAITAFLFATLFKNAGSHREAMEGIVMLFAACVMFYVSYWLFAKRESEKWQQFIKQKMSNALSKGSLFALGLTAFLAVFREGAETILFYQALFVGNKTQSGAIILGFILATVALIAIYRVMKNASKKIPYRLFFTVTALFLYYMAFYFIGGGILELQTAGWIHASPIPGFPQISWLGIFPNWQNVGVQAIFLILSVGAYTIWKIREKRAIP